MNLYLIDSNPADFLWKSQKKTKVLRIFYLLIGTTTLVIGLIGVLVPLIPTTPLILISGFCFSKSSPRIHHWLITHKTFGPILNDWENGRIIRPKAKCYSITLMSLLISYSIIFVTDSLYLKVLLFTLCISVTLFILSRPSN